MPDEKISMAGPVVLLRTEQVQTVALAIHELATNAVRHGALQEGSGQLAVQWLIEHRINKGRVLVLEWTERGVTMPAERPPRIGYGRTLIERSLRFTLRASTELGFGEDGIFCRIEIPLEPQDTSRITSP
jgi:two-component system CheB/CheR fusion protein